MASKTDARIASGIAVFTGVACVTAADAAALFDVGAFGAETTVAVVWAGAADWGFLAKLRGMEEGSEN